MYGHMSIGSKSALFRKNAEVAESQEVERWHFAPAPRNLTPADYQMVKVTNLVSLKAQKLKGFRAPQPGELHRERGGCDVFP